MTRTLRGAWSRRATLLPLLLLTTVVVTGTVAVVGLADRTGGSVRLALPLLLLGAVAVPATGRDLAAARRAEIALARLRGLTGGELVRLVALEPLLVLVTGAVGGLLLGAVVAAAAGAWWFGASTDPGPGLSDPDALLAGASIVVVGLVAVLLGMAGALREPLSTQVSTAARPRPATTGALFVSVLVFAGAAVAVYRSAAQASSGGGDPDWVVLAGPALVGLAVGQVAVWLVHGAARVSVGRSASGSLGGFLAVRRLARVAEAAGALRLLVAGSVVTAFALTGASQIDGWTDQTARLRAGAPLQLVVDTDALGALELTRTLDPEGRWLMAAVVVPGEGSAAARRAFIDTDRYADVVGDFLAGTPAGAVGQQIEALGGEQIGLSTGDELEVSVAGVSTRLSGRIRPRVVVGYLDATGSPQRTRVSARLDLSGSPATASATLTGCPAGGCTLTDLTLARTTRDSLLPWVLTALDFGGTDGLAGSWRQAEPDLNGRPGGPLVVDGGLLARSTTLPQVAVVGSDLGIPVLATDSVTWADAKPLLDSTGGDERPADELARLAALPLVEADGLLADLRLSATGAPPTVPAAQVLVLAAEDTPTALLAQLADQADQAGAEPLTLAEANRATALETGAAQGDLYALLAGFAMAVAALALTAATARQRRSWRRDVAALRVVGVPMAQLRRAGRTEALALGAVALLATVAGAVVAVRVLLADLSLVRVPDHSLGLQTGLEAWTLAATGSLVAALVLGVVGLSRRTAAAHTRPATLREEAQR